MECDCPEAETVPLHILGGVGTLASAIGFDPFQTIQGGPVAEATRLTSWN